MNFKEIFKKFWFVILMGVALLAFVFYYAISLNKADGENTVASKVVDGKNVIYSINDENYFADDLFNQLNSSSGPSIAYNIYKRNVISKAIKTTSEMESTAASYAAYMLQYYGEDQLTSYVKQMGYNSISDLTNIYIDQLKEDEFVKNFLAENESTYVTPLVNENNIKKISHILIMVDDVTEETDEAGNIIHVAHPTEEEQAALDTVLEELKTRTFEEVAIDHSEDGSASSGGLLGIVGNFNSSYYVKEFSDTCLALKAGEVSDVVTTEYGYHIIKAEEATTDEILEDTTFYNMVYENSLSDLYKTIQTKGEELGYEIVDEDLKNLIDKNINGSEASK